MSYPKPSFSGGAVLYSPPQSTMISGNSANTIQQTPSTENNSVPSGAIVPAHQQQPDYHPQDCINVSPTICPVKGSLMEYTV